MERYCAYQERCRQEASIKLQQLGVTDELKKEKIISRLEKTGFVNEARFAKAFARDKFNLHQWGKVKIKAGLQQKNIPEALIETALREIEDSEYIQLLNALLRKKEKELAGEKDAFIKNNKLAAYLTAKGFEPELIWEYLKG